MTKLGQKQKNNKDVTSPEKRRGNVVFKIFFCFVTCGCNNCSPRNREIVNESHHCRNQRPARSCTALQTVRHRFNI